MKKLCQKWLTPVLAVILCAGALFPACSKAPAATEPQVEVPTVTETVETTVSTEPEAPDYDGVLQSLANGDSFYTPATCHSVSDDDRAVLYYNDLLLVFTDRDLSQTEMDAISQAVEGRTMGVVSGGIHAFQVLVEEASLTELEALAKVLMDQPNVLYACCEYPVQIMGAAEDNNPWDCEEDKGNEAHPDGLDWWAEAIGAYSAWEYADSCQEIRVGVVDDGFYTDHEDLEGKITFVTNVENNTAADHGTFSAGIITANNNSIGIRGIVDTAKLYCADLWPTEDPNAYHTMAEYLAVINYMAQCGVRVVNNSWGCYTPESEAEYLTLFYGENTEGHEGEYAQWLAQRLDRDLVPTAEYCIVMISQLISSGYGDMIHVEGAGNNHVDARLGGFFCGVTEDIFNAMDPRVLKKLDAAGITYSDIDQRILIVGAVENTRDARGNYLMTDFSNYGETVDICAPGQGIYSTIVPKYDIAYGGGGGTSFSTPMVTGSVAFLWALDPELTVTEVRELLLSSAKVQAVGTGYSQGWTCPMLNLGAAVEALVGSWER